jgi:putative flippase GtrA
MPFITSEFRRFVFVGVLNTLHYYAIYLLLLEAAGIHYFAAHILGFTSSLIGSFFLNTIYTYKVKPTWRAFITFPVTQLFNSTATAALLYLLVEQLSISRSLAPIAAILITLPVTFILTGRVLKRPCKKQNISYHA